MPVNHLLPRDLRSAPEYEYVQNCFALPHNQSATDLTDFRDLTASPDGTWLAFTARRRSEGGDEVPCVAIASLRAGAVRIAGGSGSPPRRQPAWSPNGRFLACLERGPAGLDHPVILDMRPHSVPVPADSLQIDGTAEGCWWSPDGSTLLVLWAEPGAEISDVFGSGLVPGPADTLRSWMPTVPAEDKAGWRHLSVWQPASGDIRAIELALNVWEASWAGPDAVFAVVSPSPLEDDWYDAHLALISVDNSAYQIIGSSPPQLSAPRSNPSGTALSFITGRASDRGLVAGRLILTDASDTSQQIDTLGADVTDHKWRDETRLTFTGVRGLSSLIGEYDLKTQTSTELWSASETIGPADLLPELSPAGPRADVAIVLESHTRPPTVGLIAGRSFAPVADICAADNEFISANCVKPQILNWASRDGTRVSGLLHQPPSRPCRGLVAMIHGGPVWVWRDIWPGRINLLPLLLSRGFAVLLPNPRGSQGRGNAFTEGIVGEVGGQDAQDVLTGIDAALAEVSPSMRQVAVIGSSYGGFLAAYLATMPGQLNAAVAISPITEWISQHYTTNIPSSDRRFLTGEPLDPASHYSTRNALRAVSADAAPVLLTAGALDLATPPAQAVMFYRSLMEHGVDASLAIYPNEGHDVRHHEAQIDLCTRILIWLEHYLPDNQHLAQA